MRTLPLQENLNATAQEGIFLKCRLASDDEPERRNWKFTLRSDTSRGEQVYQAAFFLPEQQQQQQQAKAEDSSSSNGEWALVQVPFTSFQLVRGPRLVPDAPPLDTTKGLFQIGLSLSKFVIGYNTTQLENFRAGFFDLHLSQIGFYSSSDTTTRSRALEKGVERTGSTVVATTSRGRKVPDTLSQKEVKQKRPVLLKLLLPMAKLLFSEQANRRKSAFKILKQKRGWNRPRAIRYGFQSKRKSLGMVPALMNTMGILGIDSFRAVVMTVLKLVLIYPLRLVSKVVRAIRKSLGMKVKLSMTE